MLAIQSIKCIYDTGSRSWSIELALAAEGEGTTRRFMVGGAQDAEMLIEAFEDSSSAEFNPETGEIVFAYEYAMVDDDDYEDEEGDEDEEESEDEEEEEPVEPDDKSAAGKQKRN